MNRQIVILILSILTFFNLSGFSQVKDKVNKVVIDAGHGGTMPGCVGKKSKEKDITLAVALKFGKLIETHCPQVKVIYTRKTDATVEVYKRAVIANENKADLFISIHCNASENKAAHGIETFVMGLEKSEASIAIAKKENADILLEKDYKTNYGGFDPNSSEASVIFSLYTSAYLKNSAILASKTQKHLLKNTGLTDRKVQQAGFWVLYKVAMPSILVELGFLSHPKEEEFLMKESTQNVMAISLYNAFVEYKNHVEGSNLPLLPVPDLSKKPKQDLLGNNSTQPKEKNDSDKPNHVDTNTLPKSDPSDSQNKTPDTNKTDPNQIYFKVQFLATPSNVSLTDSKFKEIPQVDKYFENKTWKYTAGNETKWEDITELLKKIKKQYPDAFIIAFRNGQKIPISEARPK
ncbi:MAG TPA: N-acetylmuramoyl-L-alanine amidase [Bacteroidales bacterium]|nr:N-acetylmuramoyl-L-alanine amidase [Bacteroidales bacterium]